MIRIRAGIFPLSGFVQALSRDLDLFRRVPDPDPVVPELANYHSNEAGVQATQQHLLPPQARLQSETLCAALIVVFAMILITSCVKTLLFSVQYLYGLYSYLFIIPNIFLKNC
jgi:hypothetical protein